MKKISDYGNFICLDCGVDTLSNGEYYMIHDDLWQSVVTGYGMLCILCLEGRIERRLNQFDFTDCAVNRGIFTQSETLKDRLKS